MIAAFTGHRPQKLGGFSTPNAIYNKVCEHLEIVLKELKPEKCISGMAVGVDQWSAEICIKLGIPFIAAIPFKGQELFWPQQSRTRYEELLTHAERIEIVSPGGYASWKMQARNQWMVDNSNVLIAVFDGTAGGTRNCFEYAEKNKKRILRINPAEFK